MPEVDEEDLGARANVLVQVLHVRIQVRACRLDSIYLVSGYIERERIHNQTAFSISQMLQVIWTSQIWDSHNE